MRKSARRIAADGGRIPCRHWRTRSERRNSIPDRDAFPLTANRSSYLCVGPKHRFSCAAAHQSHLGAGLQCRIVPHSALRPAVRRRERWKATAKRCASSRMDSTRWRSGEKRSSRAGASGDRDRLGRAALCVGGGVGQPGKREQLEGVSAGRSPPAWRATRQRRNVISLSISVRS